MGVLDELGDAKHSNLSFLGDLRCLFDLNKLCYLTNRLDLDNYYEQKRIASS